MRVTKVAGEHAVPVLATLLLLSFAKFLCTIFNSLSVTFVIPMGIPQPCGFLMPTSDT